MPTGPVPKRSEERIRRNHKDIDKPTRDNQVTAPKLNLTNLHPIARDMYKALQQSAQSRYYQESDWQMARMLAWMMDKVLQSEKPNAQLVTAIGQYMDKLLVSEGSRRQFNMEIEIAPEAEGESTEEKVISMYKDMFSKQSA